MQEVKVVKLEDDKEYNVMDRVEQNGFTYLLLSNVDDDTDICIRKEIVKDDKTYIAMLSNEEEFDSVIKLFA